MEFFRGSLFIKVSNTTLCFIIKTDFNFFNFSEFFRERFELVDCWMLWMRYKEEIVQVKKEMFTYLKTLMAIWSQLKSDIEKYRDYVTKFSDNCSNVNRVEISSLC